MRIRPRIALTALSVTAVLTYGAANLHSSGPGISAASQRTTLLKGEPDAKASKKDVVGNQGEADRGPLAAADEDYANRAYPAQDVPFQATLNAQTSFNKVLSRGQAKNTPGVWNSIGASTAIMPGVLTFTGNQYITAGRITALAIAPTCTHNGCRVWAAAAGGGVWRTDNALSGSPNWAFISGSFATNAIGSLTVDPTDPSGNTIYAGTGEPNASGDSEAGMGIYKSTDGGDTWTALAAQTTYTYNSGTATATGNAFQGRSISQIVVDPVHANVMYVGSTRGVRGVSSVTGGATTNPTPGTVAPFGLYKSTDGGATFNFIWNGNKSVRGVNQVALDPSTSTTVYAAAFGSGIYRSTDAGATWTKIYAGIADGFNIDRSQFAVTTSSGKTRMYVANGNNGRRGYSRVFRSDDVTTTTPTFISLTSSTIGTPGYATFNYCTGQCWYDNGVYTPAGHPDTVMVIGSNQYGEAGLLSNGRAVVLSKDAGSHFTDMTRDASSDTTPNGLHPDQHALVFDPNNPDVWIEGSDGGLMRSGGSYSDVSYQCDTRNLSLLSLATCKGLLAAVPSQLFSLNKGFSTLQFQSISANPANPLGDLLGGTQDNGTWSYSGSSVVWNQAIYGDGGQSGYNAADPSIRFNTFFGEATDTNFQSGDPTKWVVTSGPLENSPEGSAFYMPIIADPNAAKAGSMFAGLQGVWRTTDNGGNQAYLEANCPEFTASSSDPNCGDWVELGGAAGDLTSPTAPGGPTRASDPLNRSFTSAVERAPSDTGTLWAATATGRVFISKNADATNASNTSFTRLDTLAVNSPGRFVSSIYVDPANANHAWISYSGYNFNTPSQPGHVFSVTYNPAGAGSATWISLDGTGTGSIANLPVLDLVQDSTSGDLYASTDFGVLRLAGGNPINGWFVAAPGMPKVAVSGLTIVPGSRVLYAATHGRSVWKLTLP